MDSSKKLNIGFLGTGGIAARHAAALAKASGIRIAALCNRHIEKAQAFAAERAPEARCFSDFRLMLDSAELDALYVCIPPGAHDGQTEAAAERGVHLFLEKPIALDLSRALSIRDAVENAGVVCQIGHHMRHTGPAVKLRSMIDDGSAGRPLFMQGSFFCNALHPAWWRDPAVGGGQLIEQAIHIYDLSRFFLGKAETASGFSARLSHGDVSDYRVDDVSASVVRFEGGALASLSATNVAEPGVWRTAAVVQCEKLMAVFSSSDTAEFIHHGGMNAEELRRTASAPRREIIGSPVDCHDEITRNFIAAIRGKEKTRSTIADGVESLRLVLAVAESSRRGGIPRSLS